MTYLSHKPQSAGVFHPNASKFYVEKPMCPALYRLNTPRQFQMLNLSLPMQELKAANISKRNQNLQLSCNNDRAFGSDRKIPKKSHYPYHSAQIIHIRRTI